MTDEEMISNDIKQWVEDGKPSLPQPVQLSHLNDWSGTKEDEKRACVKFWIKKTREQRAKIKANYETLIAINDGSYKPGVYGVFAPKGKRASDQREYPTPMPWMHKAYQQGLEWINEVIEVYDK